MTDTLVPFVLAAAVLLVVAGAPKVLDPADTVRGLRSAGLPGSPGLVRVLAVVEVVAGVAALVGPSRPAAAAVALLYAGFTGFVLLALARGGVVESCGCLGRADTPPTRAHAIATGLVALVAGALAVSPPAQPWWSAQPALVVVLAAVLGFLLWQVIAVLPTATAAAARSAGRSIS